jgi:dolichol-phosphate mannosyltransferase
MYHIVCLIPTLNECDTVTEVVQKALPFVHRVIVIDGHSNDDTCILAQEAGAKILYQQGKGKGMALRTAFNRIRGDIYIIIDGDATYDASEITKLLQPVLEDTADIVIGSRLKGKMETGSISRLNKFGNRLFNLLINTLFQSSITDSQSGFRVLNNKAVRTLDLSSTGFEIETEITVKALKHGLRILELPITYARRRGTPSKLNSFKAGSRILKTIISNS